MARYVLSDGRELETPDGDIGAAYVELARARWCQETCGASASKTATVSHAGKKLAFAIVAGLTTSLRAPWVERSL